MWWLIGIGAVCVIYGLALISGDGKERSRARAKVVVRLSPPSPAERQMKALVKAVKGRNKPDDKKKEPDKPLPESTIRRIQDEGTRYIDN
jgi:hypothetical protein